MEHDDEDDAQLLGARTQVVERFAAFYRRHVDAVLAYYAARGVDAWSAADLTAETFAAAYLARHRYRPQGGSAAGWLLTIAARRQVDATRRWSRERRAIERLGLERPEPSSDDVASYHALLEDGSSVLAALEGLPAEQRDAVRARVLDELPYEEVARLGGSTEPAARQRVRRGLSKLRTRLEDR